MVDDSYYITPHETALAVVATAMKKARLQLDTLIVNSIMGGILFSAGGMLFLSCHANNPEIRETNPGLLDYLGALTYSIGLFYVIINGTDLFNSNILFFTVGVLRNAISLYDLLISWFVSWFCNLGGTLFVAYVICHLSGITQTENYITASKLIAEEKASATFIQTFIKGIAGNFYVCLAVYLQLMAKPLHVKLILMTLPIFTFVAMGFTHAVADMYMLTAGMINGADLSVAKLIWKLFIPSALGNIVGGCGFAIIVPFYLHLVVVERDRRNLALPQYDARDEQPELNVDSRVVRIPPKEAEEEEEEAEIDNEMASDEKTAMLDHMSNNSSDEQRPEGPFDYRPETQPSRDRPLNVARTMSALSKFNSRGMASSGPPLRSRPVRSPPGVFPVRGMGMPLTREMTIADEGYSPQYEKMTTAVNEDCTGSDDGNEFVTSDVQSYSSDVDSNIDSTSRLSYITQANTVRSSIAHAFPSAQERKKELHEQEKKEEEEYDEKGGYNVLEHKLGTKLERAITKIASHVSREGTTSPTLPKTTQDLFPHNQITHTQTISNGTLPRREHTSNGLNGLFRTFSKPFKPSASVNDIHDIYKRLSDAGITNVASKASDNIAGIDNYDGMNLPPARSARYSWHSSHPQHISPMFNNNSSHNISGPEGNETSSRPSNSRHNSAVHGDMDRRKDTFEGSAPQQDPRHDKKDEKYFSS